MAKKINESMPATFLADQPADQMLPTAVPTPDNTPVPGGGRWAWDYSLACWVALGAPAIDTPATQLNQPE